MRGLIVVSFFLFVQCSCSHIFRIQNKTPDAEDLIVKMRRTACYGTCPQYEIHIYKSGFIYYKGKMFVEKKGCFFSYISSNSINQIKTTLDQINFFQMEDNYLSPITDIPSVILEVSIGDKRHVVKDRLNGPQELKNFHNFIDSLANSVVDWTLCVD